jgi:hypothetical protein
LYGTLTEPNQASIRRTTSLLETEGLIAWRMVANHIRRTGNQPLIFGLTEKGISRVDDEGFITPATKVFKPNSDSLLPHEYEISEFHFQLKALCKRRGWQLYWQQVDLKCAVNPDAYFRITKEHGERFHFFLEIEKTKPGNFRDGESKIMRNLGKYYEYFDSDKCEREWADFRKFRVIVTLRNDERRGNLLKELEERYKNRMFWLTSEPAYKEDIGGEIFKTPKDYEKVGYAFLSL